MASIGPNGPRCQGLCSLPLRGQWTRPAGVRVVVAAPPQFLKKGRAWRRRLGPPDGGGLCRKGRRAFGPRVVDSPAGNAYEVSVTGMPFCHICHSKHGGKSATSGGFPPARQGGCLVFTNWRPSFLKAPTTTLTAKGVSYLSPLRTLSQKGRQISRPPGASFAP